MERVVQVELTGLEIEGLLGADDTLTGEGLTPIVPDLGAYASAIEKLGAAFTEIESAGV